MWIDIFHKETLPIYTVNVKPRKPEKFQLRVIVWNTDDVVLNDTNFLTGEASSDIFVRSYFIGEGEDDQSTDIHYRSLSGEGNFNWRMIFNFDYLKAEEMIIFNRSESPFSIGETEFKQPPILTTQIWDADIISSNDCLGSEGFNLISFPRAAIDKKRCSLEQLDPRYPRFNLFKQKNVKGWWPVSTRDEDLDMNVLVVS